jgi:hypothetical protein
MYKSPTRLVGTSLTLAMCCGIENAATHTTIAAATAAAASAAAASTIAAQVNATQRLEELLELKEELQGQLDAAKASLKVTQGSQHSTAQRHMIQYSKRLQCRCLSVLNNTAKYSKVPCGTAQLGTVPPIGDARSLPRPVNPSS